MSPNIFIFISDLLSPRPCGCTVQEGWPSHRCRRGHQNPDQRPEGDSAHQRPSRREPPSGLSWRRHSVGHTDKWPRAPVRRFPQGHPRTVLLMIDTIRRVCRSDIAGHRAVNSNRWAARRQRTPTRCNFLVPKGKARWALLGNSRQGKRRLRDFVQDKEALLQRTHPGLWEVRAPRRTGTNIDWAKWVQCTGSSGAKAPKTGAAAQK